uniref:C-type lectin domain-containing protein n=1 Tax=Amazona collaria TaxID=241587 RepID=A0A8B9ISY4_9PSIT
DAAACAQGWAPFQDGCYRVFRAELSWARAEAFCRRFGAEAHLASVHSASEHRAIAAMLGSGPCRSDEDDGESSSGGLWIGLHRPEGSRRWRWSDSSELDYGSGHRCTHTPACTRAHTRAHTRAYMHTCTHVPTRTHAHTCTHAHTHTCTHAH